MRYIDPSIEAIPVEINYSNIKTELNNLIAGGDAKGKVYRGEVNVGFGIENRVTLALKRKYKSKCGYCESYASEPCVEHHRPVGSVSSGSPKNKGYYWLAYEWSNMVASCDDCNQPPYKGTHYPVGKKNTEKHPKLTSGLPDYKSFRYHHYYNTNELPHILHPEYCLKPDKHFRFNLDGSVYSTTVKGKASIKVYGLDRDTLRANRKELYDNLFSQLERLVLKRFRVNRLNDELFLEGIEDLIYSLLDRIANIEKSYILFTKYMLRHTDKFFIAPFPAIEVRKELEITFKLAFAKLQSG